MNQKEEEFIIIQLFSEKMPDFPKGRLSPHESPDFILHISKRKKIGIELTRLNNESAKEDPGEIECFTDSLKNAIRRKNEKLYLYQNPDITELWLLIHSDYLNISSSFNLFNYLEKHPFRFGFTRVFLFDIFESRIWEIGQKT